MTLHKDKDNRPKRQPMGTVAKIVIFGAVALVLAFVFITLAVTGQSFF